MKKLSVLFCVFSFILPVALGAVDLDREFLSIDPESFVNNMRQGMAGGAVADSGIQHYNDIEMPYEITAPGDSPGGLCIFYSAPKMGADEFFSFYKETIQYYIDRAFAVYTSASIAGDEMEPAVHVCIDGKPVIRIYGKYSPTRGLRGFGIAYDCYEEGVFRRDEWDMLDFAFNNSFKTEFVNKLSFAELKDHRAYIINCDINAVFEHTPGRDDLIDANMLCCYGNVRNREEKYGHFDYQISICLNDQSLKDDPVFLSSYIRFSDGTVLPVYSLLKAVGPVIVSSDCALAQFCYVLKRPQNDESVRLEKYMDKFSFKVEAAKPSPGNWFDADPSGD